MIDELKKILRFIRLYGLKRTLFKVAGRDRNAGRFLRLWHASKNRDVGVIGCGQFAFSTIGYFLNKSFGNRFVDCFDIDSEQQETFSDFYKIQSPSKTAEQLISNPKVQYIYIASNHASHAPYAVKALAAGKCVYVEKPVAVSNEQLLSLISAVRKAGTEIYAGYNRPFSPAVRMIYPYIKNRHSPITLNCFVYGHSIPPEHWYRKPEEGTRVCGNIGHWLDLAVHILSWGELPDTWDLHIAYSDVSSRDDNLSISMTSAEGDLVVIVLTSRNEPFEGIYETINFQCDNINAKIDDFRKLTIWKNDKCIVKRYWPKDVGHYCALAQPFSPEKRNWSEVVHSSLLMLAIQKMVLTGAKQEIFSFSEELEKLCASGDK